VSESDKPRPRRKGKLTIGPKAEPELALDEASASAPAAPLVEEPLTPAEEAHAYKKLQRSFMIAVGTGLATALIGYVPHLDWLGFAGPMVSIIAFYLYGRRQGFIDRSDTRQQFADSCYFLGFLLTMIAMLVGFLPAGLFKQEITSQGILRHFSIALGATALGLVFRILVLQGGRALGQIAADVEESLTQYARKVSEEAKNIGEELSALKAQLEVQREQVGSIVTKDLKEVAEAAFEPIARSVTAIATSLEAQSANVAASAANLQQALNRSAEQLVTAAEVRTDASEAAEQAMTSVAEALQQFDNQMSGLRSQLADVISSSSDEIARMTDALQKGTALAPSLAPALEHVTSNVSAVSEQLDDLRGESTRLAERVSASLADDGRLLAGLENVQDEVVGGIRQAGSQAARGIAEEGETARQTLQQTRTQIAQHMDQERQAFSAEISRATDRLAEILQGFAARIEEVRAGAPR
jgi:hypothetical protein